MLGVGVGEEEDRLFERLDLGIHLVRLDVRLELGEVVHGALAVRGGDHVRRVLPDVLSDLAPRGLDGGDGVGECAVLRSAVSDLFVWVATEVRLTMSKRTASA